MTRSKKSSAEGAKGPSQRMLRVGELISHKIAEMLVRGEGMGGDPQPRWHDLQETAHGREAGV